MFLIDAFERRRIVVEQLVRLGQEIGGLAGDRTRRLQQVLKVRMFGHDDGRAAVGRLRQYRRADIAARERDRLHAGEAARFERALVSARTGTRASTLISA